MFVLVEPFKNIDLIDTPDLGCAMLIAACKEKGIDIHLYETQPTYLEYIFDDYINQTSYLIYKFCLENEREDSFKYLRGLVKELNIEELEDYLYNLYIKIIKNKSYSVYFNNEIVNEFSAIFKEVMRIYEYYCNQDKIQLDFLNRIENDILLMNPSMIGFSLYSNEPFTKKIRERFVSRNIPIIIGGAFTSQLDRKDIVDFFSKDNLDYLLLHAGDVSLPKLICTIENKESLSFVPNLVYRENGILKFNDIVNIESLDDLPVPDFSQFSLEKYITPNIILPLQSARGCTWRKCSFCAHHKSYLQKYICYSIDRLVEIIKIYKNKYGCNYIVFNDEEIPPGRALQISEAIINNNIRDLNMTMYGRLSSGFTYNILEVMKKAGFKSISWGLESGSDYILKLMNKGINTATAHEVLKNSYNVGISNTCWILFGFPGEKMVNAEDTIQFLIDNKEYVDMIMISKFQLEKGSPIYNELKESNLLNRANYCDYDVDSFIRKINFKIQVKLLNLNNDRYNSFGYTNVSRNRLFILASNLVGNISDYNIKELLFNRKISPVVIGSLNEENRKFIFYNTKITHIYNKLNKLSERKVNKVELEFIKLSDGKKNFLEISKSIENIEEISEFVSLLKENNSIYLFKAPNEL